MSPPFQSLSLSGRRRQQAAGERIGDLYEQHGRMVYGVCRLILRDPTDAEDAAQQTFLSAYRGLLAGQEPREPAAWLGTIARNECRKRFRDRSAEPLTLVTDSTGDATQREVGRRAEAEALCAALAELPPQQRDAIVLREFYGLSYAEVAAALGLSGAAVESLLFRSRRRLQDQLRPLRAALGALTLPPTLGESLAQALPGFGGAGSAGAGAAVLAKVGGAPLAAKLAAAAFAVGAVGTAAGLETGARRDSVGPAPPARSEALEAAQPARTIAALPPLPRPVVRVERDRRGAFRPDRVRRREEGGSHESGSSGEGGGGSEADQSHGSTGQGSGDGGHDGGTSGGGESGGGGSSSGSDGERTESGSGGSDSGSGGSDSGSGGSDSGSGSGSDSGGSSDGGSGSSGG